MKLKFIPKISILKSILMILTGISFFEMQEIYSSITILACSNTVPSKVPCIIRASTYNVEIVKVDICKNNPFPNFRSTPDYGGSYCLNLYNIESNPKIVNLARNPTFKIPKDLKNKGEFNHISVIFKNKFTVSGKYQSGEEIWITSNKGPKNPIKTSNSNDSPRAFTEKLSNWRGSNNIDNKYCDNDGGTSSRCDLNYNGNKLTAIGLDNDLVETSGNRVKYVFYNLELNPPITLNSADEGFIDIKYKKNLEVYGNGKDIKTISTAPLIFRALYRKENL